jgi:hypothetical protein
MIASFLNANPLPLLSTKLSSAYPQIPNSGYWRDVTAGDGSIGPRWIPKPELKNYKVEIRLHIFKRDYGVIARAYRFPSHRIYSTSKTRR